MYTLGFHLLYDQTFVGIRNLIEEPGVLSPEFHLSTATWSSLNELLSVLEDPYAATLKLQAEDLISGVFVKNDAL